MVGAGQETRGGRAWSSYLVPGELFRRHPPAPPRPAPRGGITPRVLIIGWLFSHWTTEHGLAACMVNAFRRCEDIPKMEYCPLAQRLLTHVGELRHSMSESVCGSHLYCLLTVVPWSADDPKLLAAPFRQPYCSPSWTFWHRGCLGHPRCWKCAVRILKPGGAQGRLPDIASSFRVLPVIETCCSLVDAAPPQCCPTASPAPRRAE